LWILCDFVNLGDGCLIDHWHPALQFVEMELRCEQLPLVLPLVPLGEEKTLCYQPAENIIYKYNLSGRAIADYLP
jgi:hypothetical protein